MVKVRKYSSEEEFHQAIKAAIAKKELVYQMLRAGATRAEMEAAGIHMAPVGEWDNPNNPTPIGLIILGPED